MSTLIYLSIALLFPFAFVSCNSKSEITTDMESKYEAAGCMLLFRELLQPSESRPISIKSDSPLVVWTDVEYDKEAFSKVPEGGYTGSSLVCEHTMLSVTGSGAARSFDPVDGVISLELRNESDVALVTVVYLEGESIDLWRRYNDTH